MLEPIVVFLASALVAGGVFAVALRVVTADGAPALDALSIAAVGALAWGFGTRFSDVVVPIFGPASVLGASLALFLWAVLLRRYYRLDWPVAAVVAAAAWLVTGVALAALVAGGALPVETFGLGG